MSVGGGKHWELWKEKKIVEETVKSSKGTTSQNINIYHVVWKTTIYNVSFLPTETYGESLQTFPTHKQKSLSAGEMKDKDKFHTENVSSNLFLFIFLNIFF